MSWLCRIGMHQWKPVVRSTWHAPGSIFGAVKTWCYGKPIDVARKCCRCGKRVMLP